MPDARVRREATRRAPRVCLPSNFDLHHFIKGDAVLAPIVELGGAGRRMRRRYAGPDPVHFELATELDALKVDVVMTGAAFSSAPGLHRIAGSTRWEHPSPCQPTGNHNRTPPA